LLAIAMRDSCSSIECDLVAQRDAGSGSGCGCGAGSVEGSGALTSLESFSRSR
jgi:hypothetical protein